MSDRRTYSMQASADAEFSERTVERSLSDVGLAHSHVIGRNRRLGHLLCYLSHIRAYGLVPAQTRCTVVGVGVQDFKSQGGREAAHYLPGQLLLQSAGGAAVEPWTVVQNATTVWDYSEQTRILGHCLRLSEGSTLSDVLIRDVQGRFKR